MARALINKLIADMNDTVNLLRKKHMLRDDCKLSTHKMQNNCTELTFSYKNDGSKILYDNNLSYDQMINRLLDSNQYYVLLYDKSIIQVEFILSKDKIVKARYLFIKKHNRKWDISEIDNADKDDVDWFGDNIGFPIFLRIDFDLTKKEEILHPTCHLTLSNHRTCRIALKDAISFSQFINFILFHFYEIKDFCNELKINQENLSSNEKKYMHIDWS